MPDMMSQWIVRAPVPACCRVPNGMYFSNLCPECERIFHVFAHVCEPCDATLCHACAVKHEGGQHG